jgi:glycosyltransferase involved in cell wall biosynthesis
LHYFKQKEQTVTTFSIAKLEKIIRSSTIPLSLNILLRGQLRFLNRYFEVIAVSGPGNDLDEVNTREGVKVIPVSMARKISLFEDIKSLFRLYALFRKQQPLIVHSITPKAGLLSMVAAWFAGVPIRMHTFTGLIFPTHTGRMQQLLILMDKLLCSCATHIYPEGQGVKNDLRRFNITSKPLKVLAKGNVNGVDLQHFNPKYFSTEQRANFRTSLGISKDDFVFAYVGRLTGDKGVNELVAGFVQYLGECSKIKLLLVGSAEGEADVLSEATRHEVRTNSSIISVGFQTDIRPYLAGSEVLVLASYREGFPNVVLQAGAMGLPCIVTDINGSNEIVLQGENGLIIPVKDVNSTAAAMKKVVNNITLYQHMKENARSMIMSRFDQTRVWNALLEEYNLVIANIDRRVNKVDNVL